MSSLLDKFSKKKGQGESEVKADEKKAALKKAEKAEKAVKQDEKTVKQAEKKSQAAPVASSHRTVLVRPLVSEKGAYMQEQNKYVFEVALRANKIEVKQAIEGLYNVNVEKVNMVNQRGKQVRFGRIRGKRRNWKKAIVTLKKGQRITTVESV